MPPFFIQLDNPSVISSRCYSPIYGKQILYFLDKVFSERSKIDAPPKSDSLGATEPEETAEAV